MKIEILTPFPGMMSDIFEESMIKRARENDVVRITVWDLRDFAHDKHKTVDDYPYGGGAGMVLKPEPIFLAVDRIKEVNPGSNPTVLLMTPQGTQFSQPRAKELALEKHLIFICGHYRGVDERVIEALVDEEISIGDYILTGGELAAAVVIDSVVRLLPGVLGNFDSAEGDSFHSGRLDHPHYTRPEEYRGMKVPEVLLSGHHAMVEAWRESQTMERTRHRRPDLLEKKKDK